MLKFVSCVITGLGLTLATSAISQSFEHSIENGPRPWTHERFDVSADKFTFGIHADLTGGERAGVFDVAMSQMSLLKPDFVISVGDLIEGGGDKDALNDEWDAFDARVETLDFPVFYVGGNHDLSTALEREVWAERYGPSYYNFRVNDVLFLILDSEDMTAERREIVATQRAEAVEIYKTEGAVVFSKTPYAKSPERTSGAISDTQARLMLNAIEANQDVRHVFIFVHKPVWLADGPTPFAQLEAALADVPYTVFNGHVQAYDYSTRNKRDYIQLATTGGKQFPDLGLSEDHITLVTVSGSEAFVANLMLQGIRDKFGEIPLNGQELCFATARCGETIK